MLPNAVPKPKKTPRRVAPRTRSLRSEKSRGHLFAQGVSLSRRAFIRRQRCVATGRRTGELVTWQPWMPVAWKELCPYRCHVIAAHVDSRGSSAPDDNNLVPLDRWVHQHLQHTWGWPAFERRLHLMPRHELAQLYEARFLAAQANLERSRGEAP